jgi:hypothetical protein
VFQLKATNEKYPIRTFFLIAIIFVLTFAFMIRIWERPYYEFALAEPFYEFRYIGSSLWYTLISMTTVGYGNIVATTPYGRVSVVCAIIVGSFLLSQQVGLLINLITLKDNEENTINQIEDHLIALKCVRATLQYNAARCKRTRSQNETPDNVEPSFNEVQEKKREMFFWVEKYREAKLQNLDADQIQQRTNKLKGMK